MKSVLQAGWLLTVAVGNIIVLIVAEAGQLRDQVCFYLTTVGQNALSVCNCDFINVCFVQWAEYVLFSSLLVAVSIVFAIMAYFYTYIDPTEIEAQFIEHEPEDKEKKDFEMTKRDLVSSEIKQTKI